MCDGPPTQDPIRLALDRTVRRERGRLIAGLTARFGPSHLALAEDVAQEAMLHALTVWSHQGMPDNPGAWLAHVARNKAVDRLRREARSTTLDDFQDLTHTDDEARLQSADIADPDLRLFVLCCNPILTDTEQLTLTLSLAGGFTAREIAPVFLTNDTAIGQRIARAKRKLRHAEKPVQEPSTVFDLRTRSEQILRALYLLFCLAYAPRTGSRLILDEICREALRLIELVAAHPATRGPAASAIAALICFQTSRLTARCSPDGKPILFKDQDRAQWDRTLIARGMTHLKIAQSEDRPPTRYHLEAAIAAAYASAPRFDAIEWPAILTFYEALMSLTKSLPIAINAAIALAFSGDPALALDRLDALATDKEMNDYPLLHLARGEVLMLLGRAEEAAAAIDKAARGPLATPTRRYLDQRRLFVAAL